MEDNHYLEQQKSEQLSPLSSPEAIEDLLQQALACLGESRFAEAASIYQEILEVEPDNIYACFNLGMISQSRGELPLTISCYCSVLEQEPDNSQVLYPLANAYRDQGCWEKAVATYQHALSQGSNHIDIHYNLGVVFYYQGDLKSALHHYQQAIALDSSLSEAFYNLGVIHFEQGAYDSAINCYEKALALCPDDVDTHHNLAVTETALGKFETAVGHYLKALELAPDDAELYNALGLVYKQLKELEQAKACFRKAISLRPDYGAAYTNMAVIFHVANQTDLAIECYSKAIEFGHQTESADYMLAALTGSNRDSAPRGYVRDLFDSYADNFDNNLTKELGYNSPAILREIAGKLLGPDQRFRKVADLGCGTGLVGSRFREIAAQMIGIDLSSKMLDKAAAKGVYNELHCGDISEFLDDYDGHFDLLVAADVLIYQGDLEPFFKSVDGCVEPNGHLLFSIEKLIGPGIRHLQASGRYAYSKDYLFGLAVKYGFSVEICQEVDLRKEKGQWLKGCIFALQKN